MLSSLKFNRGSGDVIIAAISSHLPERKTSYEYTLTAAEQKAAGLPKKSVIKLGKIVTIDQRLVRKSIGKLPNTALARIYSELQKILQE